MKKLFLLLSLPLWFMACSSSNDPDPDPDPKPEPGIPESEWLGDWNDPENPNYETYKGDYNPLEGVWWELTEVNGKATDEYLIYKFYINLNNPKDNSYQYCITRPAEGKDPSNFYIKNKFVINDKQVKINDIIYEYSVKGIVEDKILTLTDRKTTQTFKVYQKLAWSWLGDWNSPNDPHYEKYKGQYNPIKGVWKRTFNNGSEYYKYTDDFKEYQSDTNDFDGSKARWYIINSKGFRREYDKEISLTFRYTLSDDGKTLTFQQNATATTVYKLTYVREK